MLISKSLGKRKKLILPGDHSEEVPPVPIPNTEVKLFSADGTVPRRYGRVGHRQAFLLPK